MAPDIFEHHDRIVDKDAHGQRKTHETHKVERQPKNAHDAEGRDQTGWDRQQHDGCAAKRVQKNEQDQPGEQHCQPELHLNIRHAALDENRAVLWDSDAHAWRELGTGKHELLRHGLGCRDSVCACLLVDQDAD